MQTWSHNNNKLIQYLTKDNETTKDWIAAHTTLEFLLYEHTCNAIHNTIQFLILSFNKQKGDEKYEKANHTYT